MKYVSFSGSVLLLVMSTAFAAADLFAGKFTTEENGELAVLTFTLEGSSYSGTILLDGHSTPLTAKRRGRELRGEMRERDGEVYLFDVRVSGSYLIMEFDDGAMIVFRRDQQLRPAAQSVACVQHGHCARPPRHHAPFAADVR